MIVGVVVGGAVGGAGGKGVVKGVVKGEQRSAAGGAMSGGWICRQRPNSLRAVRCHRLCLRCMAGQGQH